MFHVLPRVNLRKRSSIRLDTVIALWGSWWAPGCPRKHQNWTKYRSSAKSSLLPSFLSEASPKWTIKWKGEVESSSTELLTPEFGSGCLACLHTRLSFFIFTNYSKCSYLHANGYQQDHFGVMPEALCVSILASTSACNGSTHLLMA